MAGVLGLVDSVGFRIFVACVRFRVWDGLWFVYVQEFDLQIWVLQRP